MSRLFDDLKKGLEEAIAYEKGTGVVYAESRIVLQDKEYNEEECRVTDYPESNSQSFNNTI